jgi:hypothetical protein
MEGKTVPTRVGNMPNPDGTTDVWFGPTVPKGAPEAN